ncbi:hypothetical protein A3C32_00155 [Candidatus Daviesbacteria bacterium RIFCSPHIGHO2_02_FULL_41_14]|uniref:Uncharacterized protein n=1 Tax=Candidatus Daviesbacteria bacterium RIFCSPLOWO2_01_FULL_40_24 TaxID=1797787 RepID=A0A1F5MIN5_9BACT|nr:MAG: hypothetical protein A2780_02975 [Candidatus Daviesbacteria bacterium RIFCSPHIGHO2_01_FULL_41_45]OGE34092.1 MAG: hypothetical protein A3C32_00155 [Candidatus Daviesbacteria bacterium RIFCSPHIGHO2_02_FULL_41_14]OGE65247.1 MAG: hypothetical protein A3B49_02350 [Candidatus Daviesbacteria bacterium RIFCSPLOWO2_01_FULL_40_24]
MELAKKIFFIIPALVFFLLFFWSIQNFITDPYLLFSLNFSNFIKLIWVLGFLILGSTCYIIFATLANDWKFILPAVILLGLTALFVLTAPANYLATVCLIISLLVSFVLLSPKLTSYLTFQPTELLAPLVKLLIALVILTSSLAYYQLTTLHLKSQGFKLPDSLIDQALQLAPQTSSESEQTQLLRQNPEMLKQYGLDPKVLDQLDKPTASQTNRNPGTNLMKTALQSQIDSLINPYKDFIPLALTGLFFLSLNSLSSLLSLLVSPLLWLTFLILEKTGYTKFTIEKRDVKKLSL